MNNKNIEEIKQHLTNYIGMLFNRTADRIQEQRNTDYEKEIELYKTIAEFNGIMQTLYGYDEEFHNGLHKEKKPFIDSCYAELDKLHAKRKALTEQEINHAQYKKDLLSKFVNRLFEQLSKKGIDRDTEAIIHITLGELLKEFLQ